MLNAEQCFFDVNNSPVRYVRGRVELYSGSTLLQTFKHTDKLKSFTIERVGEEGKFFGFGIVHKLNVKLLDKDKQLVISTANTFDVAFGVGCDFIYAFPLFKVSQVRRDENTGELSITAYDALYQAANHTVNDLGLPQSYTIAELAAGCAAVLGVSINIAADGFNTIYPAGANFEGNETVKDVLDAIAEATQTIYFLNNEYILTFKRLDKSGSAVSTITRNDYFTLENSNNRRIAAICAATELGDDVIAKATFTGTTQYIRDNPLWDMRVDIGALVDAALAKVSGLTISQFELDWRGNFLLEIGDKININSKDDEILQAYLLDDTITYDGAFRQKTRWKYTDNEQETAANPSTLGESLKQTYARVDKANKQITLLASETADNSGKIASLTITTDNINSTVSSLSGDVAANANNISSIIQNADSLTASVESVRNSTEDALNTLNGNIATLTKKVSAVITEDDVALQIQSALDNGVDKITTETGYTFDAAGLTVSRSDSEMTTTISEDGMLIKRNNMTVLTANNVGVIATNLHANTYLIIGNNSRFEDYGSNRTGCFWIGG